MRTLILLCALPLCSYSFTATSYSASPTQAILTYTAPDNGACTIEVSESDTYAPLVHDVDAALFTGSNLDSRPGALTSGTARIFLIGTRKVELALDGQKYSRALQQGTLHYYRVTCGASVASGTFTTKILPFGATYQDLMPMNPDGTYNFPSTPLTRNYHIVDPQTGVLLNRVTLPADSVGFYPPWTSTGGFGSYCADDLSAQGNYHCSIPGFGSTGDFLYAINPTTGNVTFLGITEGLRADLDPTAAGYFGLATDFGEMANWGYGSSTALYGAVNIHGRNTIARWVYTGNDTTPAGIPPLVAPGNSTDMLGGHDLNELARAFNPHISDFDLTGTVTTTGPAGTCAGNGMPIYTVNWVSGKQFVEGLSLEGAVVNINGIYFLVCTVPTKTLMTVVDYYQMNPAAQSSPVPYRWQMFSCQLIGSQANYGLIKCPSSAQDSPTWEGAFDFGNGIPYGTAGSTARMAAFVAPWAIPGGARWSSDHSFEFLGEREPIFTWATSKIDGSRLGWGPYKVLLGSSLASEVIGAPTSAVIDRNVTITSAGLIGKHISPACTDVWTAPSGWVDGEPLSACYPHFLQTLEVGDVLAFVTASDTISEFIQITAKHSSTSYDIQRHTQAANTTAPAHSIGEELYLWPGGDGAQYNAVQGYNWGYVFWDFVNSPNGTEHPGDFVLNWGSHPVTRLNHRTQYSFDPNAAPTNKAEWGLPPTNDAPVSSVFAGIRASGDGNFFQKHPSMASGSDYSMFDVWFLVGGGQSSNVISRVPGTVHVWKTLPVGPALAPKIAPVFAKTYGRSLVDVSAPGKLLSDADDGVWCYAWKAGECALGSAAGDIYFSLSTLDAVNAGHCTGGENGTGQHDICIANWTALASSANQSKFIVPNDTTGAKTVRPLSRVFSNWEQVFTIGGNLKLTYAGDWALLWRMNQAGCCIVNDPQNQVWALKVPPDPGSDGIDRSTFVPAVLHLTPPAGEGIARAQVKFWYTEQGGTLAKPYCTSRREACVATRATISDLSNPFWYATTETYTPASCATSCTITLPVDPLHTAYYSVEYLDAGGTLVTSTQGIAMENTIVAIGAQAPPPIAATTLRGVSLKGGIIW